MFTCKKKQNKKTLVKNKLSVLQLQLWYEFGHGTSLAMVPKVLVQTYSWYQTSWYKLSHGTKSPGTNLVVVPDVFLPDNVVPEVVVRDVVVPTVRPPIKVIIKYNLSCSRELFSETKLFLTQRMCLCKSTDLK